MIFLKISLFLVLMGHVANVSSVPFVKGGVVTEPRIVGGIDAPEGYAPHMMALVFGESITSLMCGASIISDYHVLTAAHCNDALRTGPGQLMPSLRGVYGSNEWKSTERRAKFTHFKNHEQWNSWSIKNDIGLLFLEEKLSQGENIAPILLQTEWAEEGEYSYATGWGRLRAWGDIPDKLQLLYVETIGERQCREALQGYWSPVDHNIEICTLHPKGTGYGMCNGDSGSALVHSKSGKQIGIVSWGFPCALGLPDIFVRVSAYVDWIKDNQNLK